jgi:hypothetical protein
MFGTRLVFGLLYHHLVNIIQHNIDNASRPTSRLKARDKRGEKSCATGCKIGAGAAPPRL